MSTTQNFKQLNVQRTRPPSAKAFSHRFSTGIALFLTFERQVFWIPKEGIFCPFLSIFLGLLSAFHVARYHRVCSDVPV